VIFDARDLARVAKLDVASPISRSKWCDISRGIFGCLGLGR
jgi:hypothetical protein